MRPPFLIRTLYLLSPVQLDTALAMLRHAPLDAERPLELVLREAKKARGLDQLGLMWAGPLKDIAEQAWIEGRQYSAEVLHEHFKREYLPELDDPEIGDMVKDGYRKWDFTPSGERVLVGSTGNLTRRGFSRYLLQVEAFGAGLGVQFHTIREAA